VSGFLVTKGQRHLGEHVQLEQWEKVLDVGSVPVPEPKLVGLGQQALVAVKMAKRTQWMVFE